MFLSTGAAEKIRILEDAYKGFGDNCK